MKDSARILSENKIRLTPQRLAVYKIMNDKKGHSTAEEIYEKVRESFPAISLATVYSILELFQEKDLVRQIRIEFHKSRFEVRIDDHHHFFCNECKQVFDVDMPCCSALEEGAVDGNRITHFHGYFYGVCKECAKRK